MTTPQRRSTITFSGTRKGMTGDQSATVFRFLIENGFAVLNHGCCKGADAQAHDLARTLELRIVGYPPSVGTHVDTRVLRDLDERRAPGPYLERNVAMLEESSMLIATPSGWKEQVRGSGTWHAIRAARRRGLRRIVVWPDGSISTDEQREEDVYT